MSCLLFKDLGDINLMIFRYEPGYLSHTEIYVLKIEYEQYKGTLSIYRQEHSKEEIEGFLTEILERIKNNERSFE